MRVARHHNAMFLVSIMTQQILDWSRYAGVWSASRRRSPGVVAHFDAFFATRGKGRAPARSATARPMIVSGAAPRMVDLLRRVRRCMSRRVFCRFCHARSRVPIVLGPFHYCASCERAAPDAPETIDDQRRSTGCRYRTIYGGSRGSASLPARAKWLGPSTPTVYTNHSTLTETKAFVIMFDAQRSTSAGSRSKWPANPA